MLLTAQGRQFRDKTRSWLQGLSLTISNINPYSADRLTIGITKILGFNFIPLFNEFSRRFQQHIDLLQQDYSSKELLAEFNKNNIDLVIISDYKHDSHQAGSLFVY
ncbi:hypothetical protein BGI40_10420 [Snodgrassella communis]|uniref:LysR family transcriptional regulator n=1 Tax=Snodgrassella communis TaxID=2946699 RepID=UPI00055DECD4|nr:LysR family transcriptional regulator [Snodgrassella communis]PIT07193.1 hypothetical protein BGI29_09820 [Snodgrassella communis]PIT25991.1 hypothetical protein BGI38_09235 [Snodgrassella communis]PIT27671.1 hypothetical protein BGI39_07770 [Snodgrassella communis]PIT31338.1 hypothetical protein BGI40_10420 [Snodgrassella communis]